MLITLAGWLLAPDLKTVRPKIEAFLQEALELKELQLGELSWHWAGNLGVKAKASSFSNHDGSIIVRNSRITVHISTMELLSGRLVPSKVRLSGGSIDAVIDIGGDTGQQQPPVSLMLEEVQFNWRFGDHSGQLDHFTLSFDSKKKKLRARIPGSYINVRMGESKLGRQLFPEEVEISFSDLSWMPEPWKRYFHGAITGEARLIQKASKKGDETRWNLDFALTSNNKSPAMFLENGAKWPFDSLKGEFLLTKDNNALLQVDGKLIEWKSGKNMIRATALWQNGALQFSATSPHLEMPFIWQGLRPLGREPWHKWLAGMKQGIASEAQAEVNLMWKEPWQALPSKSELKAMRYHVTGHVEDADIALGLYRGSLTRTAADVELDEKGLEAIVTSTQLPDEIGSVSGGLNIPWKTLELNITGRGKVDAGRLHTWMDREDAEQLHWSDASANSSFSIGWKPGENMPRKASINLKPLASWSLKIKQIPVQVTSGEVRWTLSDGIEFSELVWSTPHLNIKTDMTASKDDSKQWQVLTLRAEAEGELDKISSYLLLPIESAAGHIGMTLNFDGEWHGNIDLKEGAWKNFLGIKKVAGEDFIIKYSGVSGKKQGQTALLIKEIQSNNKLLRMRGSGDVSNGSLRLKFNQVETASFSGSIDIRSPFGPEPWELAVDATYLNRTALPDSLSRDFNGSQNPWALRAKLERFVWDDAEMKDVSIKLASSLSSTVVLKAASLHSGELTMSNLSSIFSLPGDGVVDMRIFKAKVNDLDLKLSATLTPEAERGIRWQGFAELSGKFGDMMKRAELSDLFENGDMHLLFSGSGEMFKKQSWWQGLDGRLRLRVDDGRILKGGTLTKFLAATSLADLPAYLFGRRDDLIKPGITYKRLQVEAAMAGKDVKIHHLAMRSSAMDVAGKGSMDMESFYIDLTLVMRPLQNLDALLSKIPIIRDMFGGAAYSLFRKIYRVYGPLTDASVDQISAKTAGLASPGLIESLMMLPRMWFGKEEPATSR